MESEPVVAEVDGVALAGSCWMPSSPRAAVLMLPGSGPSTRDNDVYFPAIREHLLAAGFGVASFDKRGVGESTGSLLELHPDSIATQHSRAARMTAIFFFIQILLVI